MDGGPPAFPRDSSCPAVLRIPAAPFRFRIRGSHPLWPAFPCRSPSFQSRDAGPYPGKPCGLPVWPLPLSLATTRGISVDVFSSPYLDVSVQAVPFRNLWIQLRMTAFYAAGFPHSEISGSMRMCRSPELIAACHVLLRLLMPRHSPCALLRLIYWFSRIMQAPFGYSRLSKLLLPMFHNCFKLYLLVPCLSLLSLFSFQCAGRRNGPHGLRFRGYRKGRENFACIRSFLLFKSILPFRFEIRGIHEGNKVMDLMI